MNLKVVFLVFLIIFTLLPLLIRESHAGTPAGTITYSAGTDTITVIGANSSHPAEFLDLYNADVAGGWGQVTQQGTDQYAFACKITIGNGSALTYFTDAEVEIVFVDGVRTAANQILIKVEVNATFTLGTLVDAATKKTGGGCMISDLCSTAAYYGYMIKPASNSASAVINLYSSLFIVGGASVENWVQATRMYNCNFDGLAYVRYDVYTSGDIYNVLVSGGFYGFRLALIGGSLTMTDVRAMLQSQAFWFNDLAGNVTVNGAYVRMSGSTNYLYRWGLGHNYSAFMVNVNCDLWKGYWDASSDGEVYRQNTFNLYVLNGALTDFVEDANVTLTHDGAVYGSWLTNSTGQIDMQTLTYGFYNRTGSDTMYGGTPWTLTITHPDWETYTSVFYPYSKIEWSISMQDTTTANNNMLLAGLMVGTLCFAGFIVYVKRGN